MKTLGIRISATMKWEHQFNNMKNKLRVAIAKLKQTPMNTNNAFIYYNMHLIKNVYFGCGIVHLTKSQERMLLDICEKTILNKLGLSEKFPRDILYARKSALGIGLLKPTTIIAILATKLYVGHMRKNDRISNII